MVNEKIGFDAIQVLLNGCECRADLTEATRVINNFIRIYDPILETLDEIKNNGMGVLKIE